MKILQGLEFEGKKVLPLAECRLQSWRKPYTL
jgi:hypothetical protein